MTAYIRNLVLLATPDMGLKPIFWRFAYMDIVRCTGKPFEAYCKLGNSQNRLRKRVVSYARR